MPGRSSGNPGEAAILMALLARGFDVAVPFGDGHPYDLVLHLEGTTFLRIQCKTAWPRAGCLIFNSHMTDHGKGALPYLGLADLFGVHFASKESVYLVPIADVAPTKGQLRLDLPRNNQRRRIRFASDYEINRWTLADLKALANGEHHEVGGQNLALVNSATRVS